MVDVEVLEQIRAALGESDRLDARRVEVKAREDGVVLRGSVATPQESTIAAQIAQEYAALVTNDLLVDPNLREGAVDAPYVEEAVPAENEILMGSPDMLAGPESGAEQDLSRALEESLPWDPPDEPQLAPTRAEYGGALSEGDGGPITSEDPAPEDIDPSAYAASDLSAEELKLAPDSVPSLDPESVAPPGEPYPDPVGVDSLGEAPPEDLEPMVDQVPGASPGLGATGEGTAGGGTVSGTPATETGAAGADTASSDPVRAGTGGTMTDAGTARGPQSHEEGPLREDFPSAE